MNIDNKTKIIIGASLVVLIIFITLFTGGEEESKLVAKVQEGEFIIEVSNSGELNAKKSEKITGPTSLRRQGIWQVKIEDLVTEGTYVEEGDYIAQLDKSEVATKLSNAGTEVDKYTSQYNQTKLDTAIEMRQLRDDLLNLKYTVEEKSIVLEQSAFEAPAVKRQAEIDQEKAERAYDQSLKAYDLKEKQNKAKMYEVELSLRQQQEKYDKLVELIGQMTVVAPKQGMVIYRRDWDGKRVTAGSSISAWNMTVATLPDLSKMISKTYVNEIDISKIKEGQKVKVTVDAFPDKEFEGVIERVANVGEQLPGGDSKVFEVTVEMLSQDTLLRPAMTTNNDILIQKFDSVLYLPQEAIFSKDSLQYVFLAKKSPKKVKVEVGEVNENFVIIKSGVSKGDEVLLSKPEDADQIEFED